MKLYFLLIFKIFSFFLSCSILIWFIYSLYFIFCRQLIIFEKAGDILYISYCTAHVSAVLRAHALQILKYLVWIWGTTPIPIRKKKILTSIYRPMILDMEYIHQHTFFAMTDTIFANTDLSVMSDDNTSAAWCISQALLVSKQLLIAHPAVMKQHFHWFGVMLLAYIHSRSVFGLLTSGMNTKCTMFTS